MGQKAIRIRAEHLYDGKGEFSAKTIIIKGNHIVDVTSKKHKTDISGVVTPAFIDAHSHIGMERQGEPQVESEVNETLSVFAPLHNPVDSIYFDDRAFSEAVDFGVLYSCVVPGSGNIIGGKAVVIRNFAPNRQTAVVSDYGIKMALGYNPRSVTKWKGPRPSTRMGSAAQLETYLTEIIRKKEKAKIKKHRALLELEKEQSQKLLSPDTVEKSTTWIEKEYALALSEEEQEIFNLLNGEKTAKVHVHKEDDALFLIQLKKRFNLNVTAEHACDISSTCLFDELASNDIPVVYGPLGAFDYKTELKNASYKHVKKLMASKVRYGLMTDHPVIQAHDLKDMLKYFLMFGMSRADAVSVISLKNAEILGIDERLGTIEESKLASLVVWDKDPFTLGAFPQLVMAEGTIIRDRR